MVCEEVCPVSPKAIGTYDEEITRWDGTKVTLNKPYMRPELCIGCGICERECPVVDDAAVYVTAVGETRSKERSLLLGKQGSEHVMCGRDVSWTRCESDRGGRAAPRRTSGKEIR